MASRITHERVVIDLTQVEAVVIDLTQVEAAERR